MSVEEIHISYSVNLIVNEYYFKQYINVNVITDGDRHAVTQETNFFWVGKNFWCRSGYAKPAII